MQDARLADCRGAKVTVKVAVGLKYAPETHARFNVKCMPSTVNWQVGVKVEGKAYPPGQHKGLKRFMCMGTKGLIWAHL